MNYDDHDLDPELNLLNCPFCGGKAEYVEVKNLLTYTPDFYVRCTKCGIETHGMYNSRSLARKIWNRRAKHGEL